MTDITTMQHPHFVVNTQAECQALIDIINTGRNTEFNMNHQYALVRQRLDGKWIVPILEGAEKYVYQSGTTIPYTIEDYQSSWIDPPGER